MGAVTTAETIAIIAVLTDGSYLGAAVSVYDGGFDRRAIPVEYATRDALLARVAHVIGDVLDERKAAKEARDAALGSVP